MEKLILLFLFIVIFIFNLSAHYSIFYEKDRSFVNYQCEKTKISGKLEINKNRIHVKIKDNFSNQQIQDMLNKNNIINYIIDEKNQYIYIVDKSQHEEIVNKLKV